MCLMYRWIFPKCSTKERIIMIIFTIRMQADHCVGSHCPELQWTLITIRSHRSLSRTHCKEGFCCMRHRVVPSVGKILSVYDGVVPRARKILLLFYMISWVVPESYSLRFHNPLSRTQGKEDDVFMMKSYPGQGRLFYIYIIHCRTLVVFTCKIRFHNSPSRTQGKEDHLYSPFFI